MPVQCNTSEKREQNSKQIIWSFDNVVKFFQYWLNFIVLTTWLASMNSESLELQLVLGRFPLSFEKSEIRFVFQLFSKVWKTLELDLWSLGGLPVSFEKSQIRFVIQCFSCIPKNYENYQFFLIFQFSLICYCQYNGIHQKSDSKIPKRSFCHNIYIVIIPRSSRIDHFFDSQ